MSEVIVELAVVQESTGFYVEISQDRELRRRVGPFATEAEADDLIVQYSAKAEHLGGVQMPLQGQ